MRLAYLAAVLPLFGTTPAFAVDSLPLVAKLLAGISDGGEMLMGSFGKGRIAATGPGAFEVTFDKVKLSFLYDEPDTLPVHPARADGGRKSVRLALRFH